MIDSDALYLVDGSGFIFRAYHALPPLTTKAGVPSGAVYGFTNMLIKLEFDYRPPYLAVIFDASAHSFRNELYSAYKANRTEPPDDLKPQFAMVRRVVEAFGVPMMESVGFEADDLIATLVRHAKEAGLRVVIISSDKDLMQLVDERCVLIDTMKDPPKVFDIAQVTEKFGVPPAQLGDVLALMGDSVDNVPGVPGIGPKTASALIAHFGSLEALLGRLDEVPQLKGLRGAASAAAKLGAHADEARLSQKLVSLDAHVDVPVDLEALRRTEPDMGKVDAFLRELEFHRLAERLKPARPLAADSPAAAVESAPVPAKAPPQVGALGPRILTDRAALAELAEALRAAPEIGMAVESSGGSSLSAALVGLAFFLPGAQPAYVPLGHRYLGVPAQAEPSAIAELFGPLLAAEKPGKYIHDCKEADILLVRQGLPLRGVIADPMIASYLIDPNADHALAELTRAHLGGAIDGRAALCGSGKKAIPFESIEIERAARFAACEAEAALLLGKKLTEEVCTRGMQKLFAEIEMPLSHVLAVIEAHGVCVDVAALRSLSAQLEEKLHAIEDKVRALTGSDINLGSPKQLQELLFDKLGLPVSRKTKTGFSVDAEVLEELAPLHPVAAEILEHRTLSKLKGTYLDALPLLVDARTGRLHTSYKQTIAATGRLSSVDPNLQNVPIRSELGREIRRAFHADRGCLLVVADYSQIELRVLAHLSEDPVLTDAFRRGEDIHRRTVVEMFGADKADDPELRRVAKMINYGIVYGLSDFGLAQRLGIERADARRYIDGYMRTYAGVGAYMDRVVSEAHQAGGARTLLGRFRPLPELGSRNRNLRMAGERMARNTPVQGTAADLLKLAMIAVQRFIDEEAQAVRMLLTVHDELVLEAPAAQAEPVSLRLKSLMEEILPLSVPLQVDLGIGPTWADS